MTATDSRGAADVTAAVPPPRNVSVQGTRPAGCDPAAPRPDMIVPDLRVRNGGLVIPHMPPLEDATLPHQVQLTAFGWDVMLGCNCGAQVGARSCWASSEARAAWAEWHKERGIEV